MKVAKCLLALVLALSLCAMAGCRSRNDDGGSSSMNAANEVSDDIASNLDELESRAQDELREDSGEGEDSREQLEGSIPDTSEQFGEEDEEDSVAAMSADFSEISALDGALKEWGSGGPTDASGRPNGATYYQQLYGEYDAYFILPESDKLYLTFDEGYENSYTAEILDTLQEKDAKAVFFITLPYAKTEPELVQRMVDEGHVLGNHSAAHKVFPNMTLADAAADIMELHDYVKANFGYEMWLFRFPEGKFSEQTLALVQSLGYKSVFWSFAYVDWLVDDQPLTIEALQHITDKAHPGAIYLLHAVSQTNAEVLDEVIDLFREKGYTIAKWDVY